MAKYLFTPLAVSASVAITASYVISITLVPAYCANFLRLRTPSETGKKADESVILGNAYQSMLRVVLKLRWPIVAGSQLLFGVAALIKTSGTSLLGPCA